jgi:hypothetical protein
VSLQTSRRQRAIWAALVVTVLVVSGVILGLVVGHHVFESLRSMGDGGDPDTPQPLAVLVALIAAALAFVGVVASSLAGAIAPCYFLVRPRAEGARL